MNRRRSKRIARHAESLLVVWLKGLLSDEEAAKINIGNYKSKMPEQTHYMAQRTVYLNAYHPKWLKKKINQLLLIYPRLAVEDINLEMVTWKVNQRPVSSH